jgi:acid phosphatase class B
MNIMTEHSDPRMGDTVFTVTGVSRANPDASLFQLPADYQITNTKNMMYKFTKSTNP